MFNALLTVQTNSILIQLLRYTVVGGLAFIVDFSTLYFFTEFFGFHYLISAAIAFIFGLIVNYYLSIKWVFSTRKMNNVLTEFLI